MKKHITWVLSDVGKSFQLEGVIEALTRQNLHISFILINMKDSEMDQFIRKLGKSVLHLEIHSPFHYPTAISRCMSHFRSHETQIVHCHLFKANVAGLIAARFIGLRKRIYTRHHSTFHHQHAKKGVVIDRFIDWLSTDIIAISKVTQKVLTEREGVSGKKIHLIPHGFNFELMDVMSGVKKDSIVRDRSPVLGIISKFIEWKGIHFTIKAFQKLLKDFPDAILLILGTHGPFHSSILAQLKVLPADAYKILAFESNIYPIYKQMDVFVHVPVDPEIEAYGQTYVESLAMQIPSVFTMSGIAHSFVENMKNAIVVDHKDVDQIYEGIRLILENSQLAKEISGRGRKDVENHFSIQNQVSSLMDLYI